MKNYQRRAITYYTCVLVLLVVFALVYCIIVDNQERNTAYNENVTETTTETTTKQEITENTTTVNSSNEVKTTEAVPTPTETRSQPTAENSNYLGSFTCTAYCSCAACCGQYSYNRPLDENGNAIVYGASGQALTPGYSIATDPSIIPYGTVVVIDGKEYIAQDTGVYGYAIDFYFASHEEALNFGRQQKEVYLK